MKMIWIVKHLHYRTAVIVILLQTALFILLIEQGWMTGYKWAPQISAHKSSQTRMGVGGRLSATPYRFILNEPLKCWGRTPFLVFLISAAPSIADARKAIRQTWGNESLVKGLEVVRLFVLGTTESPLLQRSLAEESRLYHDIIHQDYMDT